jgi:hypothetical protein
MKIKLLILYLILFVGNITATAQNIKDSVTKTKIISLRNGTEYIGEILSDDGRELLLNTISIGKIYIAKSEVREIKELGNRADVKEGVYVGDDIFSTRYFISTNGFTVRKKDTYVMLNLIGPEFQKAVTDHFSLGIMTTWGFAPFAATGKYSIPIGKDLYFGAGFIAGSSTWIENFRFAGGLAFSSITYGNKNYNVSVSGGYGFLIDFKPKIVAEYSYNPNTGVQTETKRAIDRTGNALLASFAGTARLGKKASFVLENFYYNDTKNKLYILIPGFRFSSNPNRAFQFGVAGVFSKNSSFPVPMASWFFKLN